MRHDRFPVAAAHFPDAVSCDCSGCTSRSRERHARARPIADDKDSAGHRARLRKRLLDAGPAGFHDYELIEYLLALTIPRVDTKPLAKRLIHDFGGIGPLLGASADTLRREGLSDATIAALKIAEATALRLLEARIEGQPVLSSWDALGDYLHAAWRIAGRRKSASCSSTPRTCCSPTRRCGRAASTKPRSMSAK